MKERSRRQRVEASLSRRMTETYTVYLRLLEAINRLGLGWHRRAEVEIYDRKHNW